MINEGSVSQCAFRSERDSRLEKVPGKTRLMGDSAASLGDDLVRCLESTLVKPEIKTNLKKKLLYLYPRTQVLRDQISREPGRSGENYQKIEAQEFAELCRRIILGAQLSEPEITGIQSRLLRFFGEIQIDMNMNEEIDAPLLLTQM
jgi:hypothetical protein